MSQSAIDPTTTSQPRSFQSGDNRNISKSEILDGRVVAKTPANRLHNLISTNCVISIGSRFARSSNEIYVGDMQVQLGKNSFCYPDVVVVNGEPAFSDQKQEILQNPTILIEIFSGTVKSADYTKKLEGFLAVPSIKECLLVNQNEMRIEHYARQNAKQWIYRIYDERDDVISLESINCKLSLAEIYAQVKHKESELSSKAVN